MKKTKIFIVSLCALLAVFGASVLMAQANGASSRKIVVFQPGVDDAGKDRVVAKFRGAKIKNLDLVNGQAVMLSDKDARDLEKQDGVLRVDDDIVITAIDNKQAEASGKPGDAVALAQTMPWGIERINANDAWAMALSGAGIKVGIIDTGISSTHPDLKNNIKGGVNTILARKGWNDDNGHGSHVAGIIAALNNTAGMVGAAPQADLYAIKVLDSRGSGYLSDIIEGLDWAKNNGIQVANMSLGTTVAVQSFHDAIIRANNAGIVLVAAAGNDGGAVNYPAAYPEVIAVSATDSSNNIASWSSRGTQVDLAAPGVSIYSTYKGLAYATLSGTSMASPHVAGAATLVLNTAVGIYDANGDGKWNPSEVQKKMQDKAMPLGADGFDNLYGWGLVDAFAAIQ